MARTPKRARNRLVRGAVAFGGGAIHSLLFPARLLRRVLNFRCAKKGRVAARMARKNWRDDAQPARDPFLRRAVARAGGAFEPVLLRGRRALAVIRDLPRRALSACRDYLRRIRRLVPEFLRRLLVPDFLRRLLPLRQGAKKKKKTTTTPPPPPPPPPPPKGGAWIYGRPPPPPPPATSTSPPPSSPPPSPRPTRQTFTVNGVVVPDGIVDHFIRYCRLSSSLCSAKLSICHFCIFEIQKSYKFTVHTDIMYMHCDEHHNEGGPGVLCDERGCSVRVRAGRDQELHVYFVHRLLPGWWKAG